jgi:hypothetical protein
MKFTNILKSIILENSRFKVLYDSLVQKPSPEGKSKPDPKKIPFEVLKALIFADPTTIVPRGAQFDVDTATVEDMENVKVGKYTNWLIKNFISPTFKDERASVEKDSPEYKTIMKQYRSLFLEDLYKVTDDLKKFERFKGTFPQEKRDIAKLTKDDVFELVKDLSLEKAKASKTEKEQAKKTYEHPGANVVFRGPNWTIIKIEGTGELQKDAACFYGGSHMSEKGESRWCTSSPGYDWWKRYLSKGPLYVVLPNESSELGQVSGLPVERYQFHFPDSQFMDRHDHQVDLVAMLNGKLKELKDYFKPEFAKGFVAPNEDKVTISYPKSSAGKFVALYGFNELFDNLPDTISMLHIENTSSEEISIDVPPTIARFGNLENLMLTKICKSVPQEITSLKNLEFLSLPDNKNLEKLPDGLSDMPNLTFISVQNSNPDKVLPEDVKQNFQDIGGGYFLRD